MIIVDDTNFKIHADFLPQPQKSAAECDWFRLTMFKNQAGDWTSKIITLSPEQARAVALAIIEHYGPQAGSGQPLV